MSVAVRSENVAGARPIASTSMPAAAPPRPNPSKVRLAILMLVAVYPLITALLYIILPLTEGWPIWGRTMLLAPLMVGSIVFFVAPRLQRHFGGFITRMPRPRG